MIVGSSAAPPWKRPLDILRFYSRKLLVVAIFTFVLLLLHIVYTDGGFLGNFDYASYSSYLTTTTSNSSPANDLPSPFNPHSLENLKYLRDIGDFWEPWASAIQVARPPIPAITITRTHSNLGVSEADARKPRQPPTKLITLSPTDLANLTSAHALLKDKLDAYPNFERDANTLFNGRGIVTVAGGEYFGPAIVGLHMLRATGSDLPVEAFVQNWDEYEPSLCEEYLPRFGARCLVLEEFLSDPVSKTWEVTHYQLKSLALLFSSFTEVLLLDSDSIPLVDPAQLVSSPAFTSTGLVGWSDFWKASETPDFYTIAGLPSFPSNLPTPCSESGQLLVDKSRHLATLLLATYYNIWGPDYFYPLLSQGALGQGDKNTFESAAVVLNNTFYRVPKMLKAVGRNPGDGFKGSGMVQYMPEDDGLEVDPADGKKAHERVAFIHANTPKMNAGHLVDEGDLVGPGGAHLRLWGGVESQVEMFGEDVEKKVWEIVKSTGCELAGTVREWKDRGGMCRRLKKHWKEVFQ